MFEIKKERRKINSSKNLAFVRSSPLLSSSLQFSTISFFLHLALHKFTRSNSNSHATSLLSSLPFVVWLAGWLVAANNMKYYRVNSNPNYTVRFFKVSSISFRSGCLQFGRCGVSVGRYTLFR